MTAPLLDLFVPVLGRPQRAAPFMESLDASQPGDVRVTVVVSSWDHETLEAWMEVRRSFPCGPWLHGRLAIYMLEAEPGSFAQKCNAALALTGEPTMPEPAPWVMLCGDDVAFHRGWLAAALAAGAQRGVCVVGTNTAGPIPDGGTPHPLLRRSYIDEQGASWDGPGSLCHEGYRHNFVDVEIATIAKDRGVWADAPQSIVEHLCHYQGKADVDPTYQISADTVEADRALWNFRSAHYMDTT